MKPNNILFIIVIIQVVLTSIYFQHLLHQPQICGVSITKAISTGGLAVDK